MNSHDQVLSRSTDELVVTPRVASLVSHFETIGGLMEQLPADLLCLRGFGPQALLEVRLALGALGVGLRDDPHADYFIAGHGGPPISISPQMLYEMERRKRIQGQQRNHDAQPGQP